MNLLAKWNQLKGGKRFVKADLSETDEVFANPDRGFYQIFPFVIPGKEPGEDSCEDLFAGIRDCILPEETLALILIDIGNFAGQILSEEALQRIREILDFFVQADKNLILRVVYDRDGKAMEREPSLFALVSSHMEQIAEIAAQFGEAVLVYQGVLIGNWGEMHGSRYLDEKHLASLEALLQDRLKEGVYRAVRTPAQLKMVLEEGEILEAARKRIGLFDDAIFGSLTDCGTYSADTFVRGEEMLFAHQVARGVPCGGEAIWGDGYVQKLSEEEMLAYLYGLQVTYLNRQHDPKILDYWKSLLYSGKGVFRGKSMYDYIGAHLGYRFLVSDVKVTQADAASNGSRIWKVELWIQNLGFAPIYRETESFLHWQDGVCKEWEVPIDLDLNQPQSSRNGAHYVFSIELKEMQMKSESPCRLSLLTRRKYDKAVIRFANRQTKDGSVWLGEW